MSKSGFALCCNVESLIRVYGAERIGFFTLTLPKKCTDPAQVQARWNSFSSGVLRRKENIQGVGKVKMFLGACVAMEVHKSGGIHLHAVVALPFPIGTLDWKAVKKRNYQSVNPKLKAYWSRLRKKCEAYGLGRHELMPVKRSGAIGKYLSKYFTKAQDKVRNIYDSEKEKFTFKGVRLIRYLFAKKFRSASCRFSYAKAAGWRAQLAAIAKAFGRAVVPDENWDWKLYQPTDITFLRQLFRPYMDRYTDFHDSKWAYWLRGYFDMGGKFDNLIADIKEAWHGPRTIKVFSVEDLPAGVV